MTPLACFTAVNAALGRVVASVLKDTVVGVYILFAGSVDSAIPSSLLPSGNVPVAKSAAVTLSRSRAWSRLL